MHMQIMIHGEAVPVEIVRRKGRNLYLRVERDGSLKVTCSRAFTLAQIESFLKEKEEWIYKKRQAVFSSLSVNDVSIENPVVYWWGEEKAVELYPGNRDALLAGDKARFLLMEESQEHFEKAFDTAVRKALMEQISRLRVRYDEGICEKNGLVYPKITLRKMKSRWGVCNVRTGHITINTQLIHYPVECLDYIILHEYTHLLVPDHSERFYSIVKMWMPDYKERIRKLK